MTHIAAVVFDLDGVLVDSEPVHARSWDAVLRRHGLNLGVDWFRAWVGATDHSLARHLCAEYSLTVSPEDLLAEKRAAFLELAEAELHPFPGVPEGVSALQEALRKPDGTPVLAVATSSQRSSAETMLDIVGMKDRFPVIVGADDVKHHKPHPAPYLEAARRLRISASQTAAIEDSPPGIESAQRAGCLVLAVGTTHPLSELLDADHGFLSPASAIEWLLAELYHRPEA